MKIATTTADFEEYVGRDDAAGAIRLLAKCGFRHVDLSMDSAFFDGSAMCSDNWREWAAGIRRAAAESGLALGLDATFPALRKRISPGVWQ